MFKKYTGGSGAGFRVKVLRGQALEGLCEMNLKEFENKNLWCGWKTIDRGSGPTKVPFKSIPGGFGGAKANDPSTWSTLDEA